MTNCISPVTDAMVERAWAAIVGTDVAGMCFQASIIRADLCTALEAVISPAQPSTSPVTSYTLRGEIADAIREYCHSVSPAAVQMLHGVERIYYSGISLDGLTDAIFAALGAGFAQGRGEPHEATYLRGWDEAIEECIKAAATVMRIEPRSAGGPLFEALRALCSEPSTTRAAPIDHSGEECPNFPGCHCVDQCCDGWKHPSPENGPQATSNLHSGGK